MRTTIDIDDVLLKEALRCGRFKSKKDTVDAALKLLVWRESLAALEEMIGPDMFYEGYDYKAMRADD